MVNGNVKIGQTAPDFEAETTYGKKSLEDFGKLCEINFHEGLALFRTRAFERFINKESNDISFKSTSFKYP